MALGYRGFHRDWYWVLLGLTMGFCLWVPGFLTGGSLGLGLPRYGSMLLGSGGLGPARLWVFALGYMGICLVMRCFGFYVLGFEFNY